ncbi:hypothetical protein Tco_1505266 [Tanacetum coccineum]
MAVRYSNDSTTSKYHVIYDNKTIKTTVTKRASVVTEWVNETLLAHANVPIMVVGLDVEWRPHVISGMSNKSATLHSSTMHWHQVSNPSTFLHEYGLDCARSADIRSATIKRWPNMYYRKPVLKHLARDVASLHME